MGAWIAKNIQASVCVCAGDAEDSASFRTPIRQSASKVEEVLRAHPELVDAGYSYRHPPVP
jgi:hypothetical protein